MLAGEAIGQRAGEDWGGESQSAPSANSASSGSLFKVRASSRVNVGAGMLVCRRSRREHRSAPAARRRTDRGGDHLDEVVAELDGVDVLET
jgi:hypothetical protein